MIYLCVTAGVIIVLLLIKLHILHRDIDALREEFAARISADSNVGISSSTADHALQRLAADMDRQVKELRRARLRYEQGDEELKHAITGISHDLRTPLTAICGYMELMSETNLPEEAAEYLMIMKNRVQLLKELSEELFRYSVVMAVSYEKRETVSLNRAVEECVAAFYGALVEAGIEPDTCLPETAVYRSLNSQALGRILSNLMSNALKYSDGDLMIRLDEAGDITFANHAAALDELSAARLTDRFYTVNSGGHSTGLGLFIARSLTKEMGGELTVSYEEGVLYIRVRFPE